MVSKYHKTFRPISCHLVGLPWVVGLCDKMNYKIIVFIIMTFYIFSYRLATNILLYGTDSSILGWPNCEFRGTTMFRYPILPTQTGIFSLQ